MNLEKQPCVDCGKLMSFYEFYRDNPSLDLRRAQELWELPFIDKHCPNCYFKRLEKPFKKKRIRRWLNYKNIRQ